METDHSLAKDNVKLLKEIVKPKLLNAWESHFIKLSKRDNHLNNVLF